MGILNEAQERRRELKPFVICLTIFTASIVFIKEFGLSLISKLIQKKFEVTTITQAEIPAETLIFDVREKAEFNMSHISGAKHLNPKTPKPQNPRLSKIN